jgi:hypothetical protein
VGVDTLDGAADSSGGPTRFRMHRILMSTISDFPALGLISSLCTKGYYASPICGPHTYSRLVKGPKKIK